MKKLLLLLLFGICTIGWRSEALLHELGLMDGAVAPASYSIESLISPVDNKPHTGMSLREYAELANTDPDAYRKLLQSHQQDQERNEVDKLMNFFTRLKYE